MSEGPLCIITEEGRERAYEARARAEICAACGRSLGPAEVVYVERFSVMGSFLLAPVGQECASPELLARVEGTETERCAGCGRGVYYGVSRLYRRRAACSRLCRGRAANAQRRRPPG